MKKANCLFEAAVVIVLSCLYILGAFSAARAEDERKLRSERRAFYTAPPVIPHEVDERDSEVCLSCHIDVYDFGDSVTFQTPHPDFTNCLQCHVPEKNQIGVLDVETGSSWKGLEEPRVKERGHAFAPPVIPHRIFLREDCLSCHHPDSSREYLRSPHPGRINCRQCHVPVQSAQF